MHGKINVITKISCYFERCRYTETAQRIFKYSDMQYTSLTLDKLLNSLVYTLCLRKKVPTFKLSITLSNVNRFSKFLHCWKAYEICCKTHSTLPTST